MADTRHFDMADLPDFMIIGGERVRSGSHGVTAVVDPGSGSVVAEVPAGGEGELAQAVDAAKSALTGAWSSLEPRRRARLLLQLAALIERDAERLATIETLDTGKPISSARRSVARTADYFRYYSGLVDKTSGHTIPLGNGKLAFTERVPIGVTGHIVPWNVPISTAARSLAPALACANTAVIKPATNTPLTAVLLAELATEAGIPPGVVNVVTGAGSIVGQALAEHPDIGHITFTGSVEAGKRVMIAAAGHVASVTLELGGKSPHVVLADAELDRAADDVAANVFSNAGQICSAGTRLLVERSVHASLIDRLADRVGAMRIGYGLDDPDMGPLISGGHRAHVEGFVERARQRGVEFPVGGTRSVVAGYEGGFYFAPTIADNVEVDDELAQEEIFGPVLTVIQIEDVEHAIEVANATAFGLAAGVHTANISHALRFARGVEAGQVFINGYHGAGDTVPFGGMKESGIGREKGVAALDAYSEVKAVTIAL